MHDPNLPQTITQIRRHGIPDNTRIHTESTDDIPGTLVGKLGFLLERREIRFIPVPRQRISHRPRAPRTAANAPHTRNNPLSAQPHQNRPPRIRRGTNAKRQREYGGRDGKGESEKGLVCRGCEKVDQFSNGEWDEHGDAARDEELCRAGNEDGKGERKLRSGRSGRTNPIAVLSCFFSGLAKSTNFLIELFVFPSPSFTGARERTRVNRLISPPAGTGTDLTSDDTWVSRAFPEGSVGEVGSD